MKHTIHIFSTLLIALLLFTAGCSDDNTTSDNNDTPPTETNGSEPTPPIPTPAPAPEESAKPQKVILPFTDPAAGIEPWVTDGMPDGTTERLGDVNTQPAPLRSRYTKAIAGFKGKTYLLATDSNSKSGLWKDDGTGRDLQLIIPFSDLSDCMAVMGDKLYFLAVDADGNAGLWQSDGTENGTRLIYALNAYYVTSISAAMLTVDNTLFLSTRGNLYVSDGTEEGTDRIKYLRYSRYPAEMVRSGAYVYITANEYSNQRLWRTDGTEAGTIELVHLGRNASIGELTDINNTLFFVQKDGIYGSELWHTDGTKANTKLVKDIRDGTTGSNPSHLTVFHNKLYFFANDGNDKALWESNGTLEGTSAVLSATHGNAMAVMKEKLYYTDGALLRESNGSASGTSTVTDLSDRAVQSLDSLTSTGSRLYFSSRNKDNTYGLWSSNGAADGTHKLRTSNKPAYRMSIIGNDLFFHEPFLQDKDHPSLYPLWKSNGTVDGTVMLDYAPPTTQNSLAYSQVKPAYISVNSRKKNARLSALYYSNQTLSADGFAVLTNGRQYFALDDGIHGRELWISDGTGGGTRMVKDIRPGIQEGSQPYNLTSNGNKLFFIADNDTNGSELWISNGTDKGTHMVKDIRPGSSGSRIQSLTPAGNKLFFVARNDTNGSELWISDGTDEGTHMVKDIRPGSSSSRIQSLTPAGDRLFFVADNDTNGSELWISDGTDEGTRMVKDIYEGEEDASPRHLIYSQGNLYFTARSGSNKYGLWISNGTPEGTTHVESLNTKKLLPLGTTTSGFFYTATSNDTRKAMFVDKSAKPQLVISINSNADIYALGSINDKLLFVASGGLIGPELWISRGDKASTRSLLAFTSDTLFIVPVTQVNDRILFYVMRKGSIELWSTDATSAGTVRLSHGDLCGAAGVRGRD